MKKSHHKKGKEINQLRKIFLDFTLNRQEKSKVEVEIIKYIDSFNKDSILEEINQQLHELFQDTVTPTFELSQLIDFLIDACSKFYDAKKITIFYNYLRTTIANFKYKCTDSDMRILRQITSTLGKLTRTGFDFQTLTSNLANFECKRALEWLESKKDKRLISILVLKEIAESMPTFFFKKYVSSFLKLIWIGLRDSSELIRSASLEALTPVLIMISERQTANRIILYHELMKNVDLGYAKTKNVDYVQASILVSKKLLCHTGEMFMNSCFRVCESLMSLFSLRDKNVRRCILRALPFLSKYYKQRFNDKYFDRSIKYIFKLFKSGVNKDIAFISIGKMCTYNSEKVKRNFELQQRIVDTIKDCLQSSPTKKRPFVVECFTCLKYMVNIIKDKFFPVLQEMIQKNQIFVHGLSQELVNCLKEISIVIPKLLKTIQIKLLDIVSYILTKKPVSGTNLLDIYSPTFSINEAYFSINSKTLALQILSEFNLGSYNLGQLLSKHLVEYLDSENIAFRREAVKACCKLLLPKMYIETHQMNFVGEIFQKLMMISISDKESSVRMAVLENLDERYDEFLSLTDNLRLLFTATHDEVVKIREQAIKIIGRLSKKQSTHVAASLRRTVFQLITQLEHSETPKSQEESAKMIGNLLEAAPGDIPPYFTKIYKVLFRLIEIDEHVGVTECVLETVGKLSFVNGALMMKFMKELLPVIIRCLQDKNNSRKRFMAVKTMGELVKNTGYVIEPYEEFPDLLGNLINILRNDASFKSRNEVMKVLGIIGPIDEWNRKIIENDVMTKDVIEIGLQIRKTYEERLNEYSPKKTCYYHQVAIISLIKILDDPVLKKYHIDAIQGIVFIFTTLGLRSVPYLPMIIEPFFSMIKRTENEFSLLKLFKQLGVVVRIVKHHIRRYIPVIFELIKKNWRLDSELVVELISLEVELGRFLNIEFSKYIHLVIPPILTLLKKDKSKGKKYSIHAVNSFRSFSRHCSDYLHMIVPVVVGLYSNNEYNPPNLVVESIKTVYDFLITQDAFEYTSRIVNPMAPLINSSNQRYQKIVLETLINLAKKMNQKFLYFDSNIVSSVGKIKNSSGEVRKLVRKFNDLHKRIKDGDYVFENRFKISPDSIIRKEASIIKHETSNQSSITINTQHLQRVWEAQNNSVKEDWIEWCRSMEVEFLKETPTPALRSCASLAQIYHPLSKELFKSSFFSVYMALHPSSREELFRAFAIAFSRSLDLPSEVLQTLLNVVEFMELNENPLNFDITPLGFIARSCHLFAMALYYKEREFKMNPLKHIDELISINISLNQYDAALGNVRYASEKILGGKQAYSERWLERLGKWKAALSRYEKMGEDFEPVFGKMRCLKELGEWDQLKPIATSIWQNTSDPQKREIANVCSHYAFFKRDWEFLSNTVYFMEEDLNGCFFKTVMSIHEKKFDEAQRYVDINRFLVDTTSVGEKFEQMLVLQQLTELEEVIDILKFKQMTEKKKEELDIVIEREKRKAQLKSIWKGRMKFLEQGSDPRHLSKILSIRELVLNKVEMVPQYITLAKLERRVDNFSASTRIFDNIIPKKIRKSMCQNESIPHATCLSFFEHLYETGENEKAVELLDRFIRFRKVHMVHEIVGESFVKLGKWAMELEREAAGKRKSELRERVMEFFRSATIMSPKWYIGWNHYGSFCEKIAHDLEKKMVQIKNERKKKKLLEENAGSYEGEGVIGETEPKQEKETDDEIVTQEEIIIKDEDDEDVDLSGITIDSDSDSEEEREVFSERKDMGHLKERIDSFLCTSLNSFFKSVSLSPGIKSKDTFVNLLRILSIWFNYSNNPLIIEELIKGFDEININYWLNVIPQIIARIKSEKLVKKLLLSIGLNHPQALVYPLSVCVRSNNKTRKKNALEVLEQLREKFGKLVNQAMIVSTELIRVGVLWAEDFVLGLNEVLKLYVEQYEVNEMFRVLRKLYAKTKNPSTKSERSFVRNYSHHLKLAYQMLKKYSETEDQSYLSKAMALYHSVFSNIGKNMEKILVMDLDVISPKLLKLRNLELGIPGTYLPPYENDHKIGHFVKNLELLGSKRRPRKLQIVNQRGERFLFLLKGNEDSRQDERVMQLFGLVNTLLRNNSSTRNHYLSITRYSVVPLSNLVAVSSWVWNSSTLKDMVKKYRDSANIPWDLEKVFLEKECHSYDHMTLMQKIELFERLMSKSDGTELKKFLFTRSRSFDMWIEKRTSFTRSLSVMSVVGYVLGLGDRHPSNLMIQKHTGKIVHCDFGDCFEIAINRSHVPEKVPFRLTRMLVKSMEVNGVDGTFTEACVRVMRVLRQNRSSLMTMLEAFVHDPLINWRLIEVKFMNREKKYDIDEGLTKEVEKLGGIYHTRSYREREIKRYERLYTKPPEEKDSISSGSVNGKNKVSLKVIKRIKQKLQGKEFGKRRISEREQVSRLIEQATNKENLAQNFVGWCSFW